MATTHESPPRVVRLHLSGFGPFLNVVNNPSSSIMRLVAKHFSDAGALAGPASHPRVEVASATELEVSVQAAARYVSELREREAARNAEDEAASATFFLHFGVNRGASDTIFIETQAVNCVVLPAGDRSGFAQPVCAPIVAQGKSTRARNAQSEPPVPAAAAVDGKPFAADFSGGAAATAAADGTSAPRGGRVRALVTSVAAAVAAACAATLPFAPTRAGRADNGDEEATREGSSLVPASVRIAPSSDAGKYLCNFLFFASLRFLSNGATGRRVWSCLPDEGMRRAWRDSAPAVADGALSDESGDSDGDGDSAANPCPHGSTGRHRHSSSLFIHVLHQERCCEEEQASAIIAWLERLFAAAI
jgi:pyrrolidone-carboxylate peptidase